MTSDVKAAAERVRKMLAGANYRDVYGGDPSGWELDADRRLICEDYLSEYPADEDEPITYSASHSRSPSMSEATSQLIWSNPIHQASGVGYYARIEQIDESGPLRFNWRVGAIGNYGYGTTDTLAEAKLAVEKWLSKGMA